MKIDIEQDASMHTDAAAGMRRDESVAASDGAHSSSEDSDNERKRVEAAIKAGEAAADADFKSDADSLRAERDELAKKLAGVADEIQSAKSEAADSADRLSRLQADWDNYRRRTERERVAERAYACEGLIKDLLPAIDDLERAIAHAGGAAEGGEVAKQLVDGVSAVHAKIVSVLEKQGVEIINPAGEPFNPKDHQAVGRVENPGVYDETIADVYQKGYRLSDKVVRPAMVTVAYGGPKRPASPEETSGAGEGAGSK